MAFKKIMIANRGEIAIRILRSCRELGIDTVGIHSTVDEECLHVKLCDESVCIGPAKSLLSYLNIPSILSAAEITGSDAIHPGFGFLSENEEFAELCAKWNITFIGPSVECIRLMGDKILSKETAKKAGVPTLEHFDSGRIRRLGRHHERKRHHGGKRNGLHVPQRIVGDALEKIRIDRDLRGLRGHQGVAVGRRIHERLRGKRTARAGTVLDDHGLAECCAKFCADQAADDVAGPTGSVAYEQLDVFVRIRLCMDGHCNDTKTSCQHGRNHKPDSKKLMHGSLSI